MDKELGESMNKILLLAIAIVFQAGAQTVAFKDCYSHVFVSPTLLSASDFSGVITVSGSGFEPNSSMNFTVGGTILPSHPKTDANGSFSNPFIYPGRGMLDDIISVFGARTYITIHASTPDGSTASTILNVM